MEVSPMNKTAIISYILDYLIKLRNVSSNMRKRVHWILEEKQITVKKYTNWALILNGWIKVGRKGYLMLEVYEMKKGVSNYILESQRQLDRLITLNNEIRCYKFAFNLTDIVEVESIGVLVIDDKNYGIYSQCFFKTADKVTLDRLSTDQVKFILTRFKRINTLKIKYSHLESIDFSSFTIKRFKFENVSFNNVAFLPREIEKLKLWNCSSPNLVIAQRVIETCFYGWYPNPDRYIELIQILQGVKIVRISIKLKECLSFFPSTVRKILALESSKEFDNLEEIAHNFPNLTEVKEALKIETISKSELKVIDPIMSEFEGKFKIRPRKIKIDSFNADELNKHPELFEKIQSVYIHDTIKFDLDLLPSEIERIEIYDGVNKKSLILNRL